jgi:hypothetical protein
MATMSKKLPEDLKRAAQGIRAIVAPHEGAEDEDVRSGAFALFFAAKAGHEIEIFRGLKEAALHVGEVNLSKALDMMIEGFALHDRLKKPDDAEHFVSLESAIGACERQADMIAKGGSHARS